MLAAEYKQDIYGIIKITTMAAKYEDQIIFLPNLETRCWLRCSYRTCGPSRPMGRTSPPRWSQTTTN